MEKNKELRNEGGEEWTGFIELLKALKITNARGAIALFLSLPVAFSLKWIFKLDFPIGLLVTLSIFALTMSIYLYLLTKRAGRLSELENISMGYFISNLFLYSSIVHYMGGIEGIAILIYFFIIVEANIVLPKRKSIIINFLAVVCYGTLAFLEYFGIIPHHEFFIFGSYLYSNYVYVLFAVLVGGVLGFNYAGFIANNFSNVYRKMSNTFRKLSNTLRREREELVKTRSQLEEAKATLEVKVEARTKELKGLTESLDEEVKQRTKELQEKIEELEKFQKFAVDRELKMVELKNKIEKLEKTLKKPKKE